jgi:hypothetical protein
LKSVLKQYIGGKNLRSVETIHRGKKLRSVLKRCVGTKNPELSPENLEISPETIHRVAVGVCPEVKKPFFA